MSADDKNTEDTKWPLPKFRFEVDLGTEFNAITFLEVSGLDIETESLEYRKNNRPILAAEKLPGVVRNGSITLKKGIFVNDNTFWNWRAQIAENTIKRRMVTINLLDEDGKLTMQWQLTNAWPTKITGTDLKSEGNEVAVETVEIAHEQLIIKNL